MRAHEQTAFFAESEFLEVPNPLLPQVFFENFTFVTN